MRVSLVVPCHNYGRYVTAAVESALRQTRVPEEILICDDGSDDGSWGVIERLVAAHPSVTAYRHDTAHGLIRTFNELVHRATGDVIVPFSADDLLSPRFLEITLRELEASGADFAYPGMRAFGAETWEQAPAPMDVDRLARENFICATSAIRRELIEAVGGYRQAFETVGFEDYDFWLTAIERGFHGVPADGAWLLWRRHESGSRNSATTRDRARLRWMLLCHHPRFFFHARSLRLLTGRIRSQRPEAA